MEEDDIAESRVGQYLVQRRTHEGRKSCKPEELIRGCQGLAEGLGSSQPEKKVADIRPYARTKIAQFLYLAST